MSPRREGPKFEWRVQYRRRWWNSLQGRIYQSAPPAQGLVEKLRRRRRGLEPVIELHVQRRLVGEWEQVDVAYLLDGEYRWPPAEITKPTKIKNGVNR